MPAVLVHGVPETHRLWDEVIANLQRDDVVALSVPGFGCPLPESFTPTKDAYAAWLADELEAMNEPVDLVGHDWGGGFVVRVVTLRPELVRTWVTDTAAVADPDYVWHQFAQIWQTLEQGEAFMEAQLGQTDEQRASLFAGVGLNTESARAMGAAFDRTMADSILTLYRSATSVQSEWGQGFVDIPKPGMAIIPSEDPFLPAELAERAAKRAGAQVMRLEGKGHWWMLEDPKGAAALLEEFWAAV